MSYDIDIWCTTRPTRDALPQSERWILADDTAQFVGKDFVITFAVSSLDAEDVPETVCAALPGIAWRAELVLEPFGAPDAAFRLLRKAGAGLAKTCHGVIDDRQQGTIELPSGVKRYKPASGAKSFSILRMSWWTDNGRLRDERVLDEIVDLFKRQMPEALPRRYGTVEPPEYKLADRGIDHLKAFIRNRQIDFKIFVGHRPVLGFDIRNDFVPGPKPRNYAANMFQLDIELTALEQPGWERQVRHLWCELSGLLQPFYGDVRVLHDFERHGSSIFPGDDEHPVPGIYWNGIPTLDVRAIVLGEPYLSHWQDIADRGTVRGNIVLLSVNDWRKEIPLSTELGDVPRPIANTMKPRKVTTVQSFGGRLVSYTEAAPIEYPPVFPFPRHG